MNKQSLDVLRTELHRLGQSIDRERGEMKSAEDRLRRIQEHLDDLLARQRAIQLDIDATVAARPEI